MSSYPEFTTDEHKFLSAMRNAVIAKGQAYVYDESESGDRAATGGACSYLNYRDGGKTASCIVGHGLLDSGLMTADELHENEGNAAYSVIGFSDPEGPVAQAANLMQGGQDGGLTWAASYMFGIGSLAGKGYSTGEFAISGDDFRPSDE